MPEPTAPNTAVTSFADALEKAYPGGSIPPDALPAKGTAAVPEPTSDTGATGATAAAPEPIADTGATGATAAAPEPVADTGATAAAPEPTPDTGATGATAAAPVEKLTDEQLEAAQKKMTPAAGTAFKILRRENKEYETRISDLQAKLASAEKAPTVDDAEVKLLKEKVDDYEKRLSIVDYQGTEEFQNKIAKPLATVETALNELAAKYKIDPADLRAAMFETDQTVRSDKLSDLSAGFNRLDMHRFDNSITDYDKLQLEKKQVLETAFQKLEQSRQTSEQIRAQAAREYQQNWSGALESTLARLTQDIPIFATTNDEKWDTTMQQAIARVKSADIAKMPNSSIAEALYKKEAFDMTLGLVSDLVKDNQEKDAMIAKLRGGTPPAGGGSAPAAPAVVKPNEGASFLGVLKDKLGGILPN